MKEKSVIEQNDLYASASKWTYDLYLSQTIWLRRALFGLLFLAILLLLSLLSHLFLLPLKEKVPYLYAFDHATGEVTKIGTLEPTTLSANWQLSRYLLIQYVRNYESYDVNHLEMPYQFVYAQSADDIRKTYEAKMSSSNANSPYKLFGKDKFVTVNIISVNKLNENTVDIKFEKILHDRATNNEQKIPKEAIVKWTFDQAETTQKMLDRDPLGFKVTYYHVSDVNLNSKI